VYEEPEYEADDNAEEIAELYHGVAELNKTPPALEDVEARWHPSLGSRYPFPHTLPAAVPCAASRVELQDTKALPKPRNIEEEFPGGNDDVSTEAGETVSWQETNSFEDRGSLAEVDDHSSCDLSSSARADGFREPGAEEVRPISPISSESSDGLLQESRPVLSGMWQLIRVEGDMEALMSDAGFSWTTRAMARGANYGVGLSSLTIAQDGDHVSISYHSGLASHSSELRVGAGEQETLHEDGTSIIAVPWWDGPALRVECRRKDNSMAMQPAKRYLQDEELVCDSTTSRGEVVKRFYARAA
jgi:hypothetical protein